MIELLQNNETEVARCIRSVFQRSYQVEAEILGIVDFPPLKRPLKSFVDSDNQFYGAIQNGSLAGVVEIEHMDQVLDINSLVVSPEFFRQGIAKSLLEFIFKTFDVDAFTVETGLKNEPATALYKKFGFREIHQWDTDFGVRKVKFELRK